jgi:hypothetical protein
MSQDLTLRTAPLRTPKAAAVAGILFSVLLAIAFVLLRISVPADPLEPGAWLRTSSGTVVVALNIIPFAGIAFLWFIGVVRDRLGQREDRFFATVFFGSGLLFLAMLFAASAMVGALILVFREQPDELVNAAAFRFARATIYSLINIYMIKMAAVFIISTSTVAVYTGFSPRWIALLGYVLAAIVLLGSGYMTWSFVVFPIWVLLVSCNILIDNLRRSPN